MKVNNILVTFWFNKVTDIKNKINYFESELSEYFHGINSIGVSADISPVYPRLTATSDGGHTKLNVSMINLQISTNFDSEFNSDYHKCFDYIKQRVLKAYDLLTQKLDIIVLYGAILVLCEVDDEDPMNLIKTNLLSEKLNGNYCESGVKIADIINNKYYRNLSFNTTKQLTINKIVDAGQGEIIFPLISLTDAIVEKEGIAISYEINDKYMFDNKENYSLNLEDLKAMLDIALKDVSKGIMEKINK